MPKSQQMSRVISRARFDDMLREKNTQIADRDRRIMELESERKLLWDKLYLLWFAASLFSGVQEQSDLSLACDESREHAQEPRPTSRLGSQPISAVTQESSQVAWSTNPQMETRWLRSTGPDKARFAEATGNLSS